MKGKFKSTRDVIIRTSDFPKAVNFYKTVLGFRETPLSKTMTGFETGAFKLYVEKGRNHGPVFEFLVPEVQAAKRKLIKAGCKLVEEDASVPRCYMRDPFGVVFNIGPE